MAEVKTIVSPLNGSNYATWKTQCKMALIKEGVWDIVNGTEVEPAVTASEKEKTSFRTRRNKALATIVLSVDTTLLYLLGDPNDPVIVWKKLSDQFQKKTWANKLALRRKLQSLKLNDGGSVQQHVKEMTEIFNELSIIGVAMDDEDRVIQLLASLPDDYSTLVTALEASEKVPNMEIVTERLLHHECKLSECKSSSSNGGAYTARHGKSVRCHHCHKIGHFQRNCPDKAGVSTHRGYREDTSRYQTSKPGTKWKKRHHVHSTNARPSSRQSESDDTTVGLITRHALSVGSTKDFNNWIIDSGATCHISNNRKLFADYKELTTVQKVTLGDGHTLDAVGTGTVALDLELKDGKTLHGKLNDVLFVPKLSYNLLSISKVTQQGKRVDFYESHCEIIDNNDKLVAMGIKRGDLYYLSCQSTQDQVHVSDAQSFVNSSEYIWHQRFGHLSESNLHTLSKQNLLESFDYDTTKPIPFCKSCVEGKIHRNTFPKEGRRRATEKLQLVHSDICGPLQTNSLSGAKYFLTFIDDKTHYIWVYVLKQKSDTFRKFLEWKAQVEKESNYKLKTLHTDNGGEYTSNEFSNYLKKEGIRHETTIPKMPEQNGVAERLNRTLVETVRTMLSSSSLPHKFWAEALSTAVYLKNRSYTKAIVHMTPYEAYNGKKPNVENLRVFGCVAYTHIPKDEHSKLDSKARQCILLGYGDTTKGYRLYDINREKVIHSRDVIFNETKLGFQKEETSNNHDSTGFDFSNTQSEDNAITDDDNTTNVNENNETEENNFNTEDIETEGAEEAQGNQEPIRRSQRTRQRPDYYGTWIYTADKQPSEPTTVTEAMNNEKWSEAMRKEMKSIKTNNVWELVKLPEGKKTIGCKWVYKIKTGADGEVERHKARLVAKGYSQQYGLDYDETFSPVARFESLRILLALAVQNNLRVHQLDITTAFLNGTLNEEVYMDQPEGFVEKDKEDMVCKLNHSIYGLKQAPRCWNSTLDKRLKEIGFIQTTSDPCIYKASTGEPFLIGVYVDDILLAAKSEDRIEEIKYTLSATLEVKDLGELKYFLGIKVVQNHKEGSIWLGQPAYTETILKKHGMDNCKSIATPINTSIKLTTGNEDSEYADKNLYQSMVGSLLYLSMKTRPDITYAVSVAARFCSNPTVEHMTATKRILRYLRGTSIFGLIYKKSKSSDIIGFSDADWGGDKGDCKSTSGFIFQIGGTAVTWKSKKQTTIALSTAEAEYIALSGAAQEAVWLKQLYKELTETPGKPIIIKEDNQAAISISKNPQYHGRVKHIDIKYHFIREQVNNHQIELEYCRSSDMIADMLTKGLGRIQLEKLRNMSGMEELKTD